MILILNLTTENQFIYQFYCNRYTIKQQEKTDKVSD